MNGFKNIAYEQAHRGALAARREKEGELATSSLEFEYLHRKRRCEMLIGGDAGYNRRHSFNIQLLLHFCDQ